MSTRIGTTRITNTRWLGLEPEWSLVTLCRNCIYLLNTLDCSKKMFPQTTSLTFSLSSATISSLFFSSASTSHGAATYRPLNHLRGSAVSQTMNPPGNSAVSFRSRNICQLSARLNRYRDGLQGFKISISWLANSVSTPPGLTLTALTLLSLYPTSMFSVSRHTASLDMV